VPEPSLATPPETHLGRGWAAGVVGASALGLGVSVYLSHLHVELFYGSGVAESLCDLGNGFNCSAVNGSPESEIFGIPQSVLAVPAYVVAGVLGVAGGRSRGSRYAIGLAGLALLAVLYSARLAWISATVIGAWCLFCMVLYAVNLALLGLGAWGSGLRPAALARELMALPARAPALVGGMVLAGGLAFGATWLGYDHVRKGVAEEAAAAAVATPKTAPKTGEAQSGAQTKKVKLGVAKEVRVPSGAPSRGPAKARVTIVEFSDFQCPFCKRLEGNLRQLLSEYPDDVRIVYAQYPMNLDCTKAPLKKSMHPEACRAAAASVCAGKQGKFWEMHDALFDAQADLGPKKYRALAAALSLDSEAFSVCLDDPDTQAAILADTEAGAATGATGTPTFFVNGRELSGAQPIEVLRAVVDAELAGNKAALDLDVAVGTETTGAVAAAAAAVPVPGVDGVRIDAFEASMDGGKAASRPAVEPARSVSWYDGKAACEAAGKRLCTEKEWLAACSGAAPVDADHNGVYSDDDQAGRKYGYEGDRLSGVCADSRNPDAVGELLTGNHPKCGTPEGVYDLVGGVKEWVGLTPATAATKGGSYSSGDSARCGYYRDDVAPDSKDPATGFRCCEGRADPSAPEVRAGRDVGEKLDALTLDLLDGGTLKTRSLAGHPAIVTFWASWCGPCQKEMPALAKLYDTYKDKGLQVVGISVDTDEGKLRAWLGAHAMPFPIARDPGGKLLDTFTNRGLPTTLWVKKDGSIRLRTTGVPPGGDKRLGELVDELLGG